MSFSTLKQLVLQTVHQGWTSFTKSCQNRNPRKIFYINSHGGIQIENYGLSGQQILNFFCLGMQYKRFRTIFSHHSSFLFVQHIKYSDSLHHDIYLYLVLRRWLNFLVHSIMCSLQYHGEPQQLSL